MKLELSALRDRCCKKAARVHAQGVVGPALSVDPRGHLGTEKKGRYGEGKWRLALVRKVVASTGRHSKENGVAVSSRGSGSVHKVCPANP